jgi:hypothetical protein
MWFRIHHSNMFSVSYTFRLAACSSGKDRLGIAPSCNCRWRVQDTGLLGIRVRSSKRAAGACPLHNPDKVYVCVLFAAKCKWRVFHSFPYCRTSVTQHPCIVQSAIARTVLEDIWDGARRGLLRSSSLTQESSVIQLALRGI